MRVLSVAIRHYVSNRENAKSLTLNLIFIIQ